MTTVSSHVHHLVRYAPLDGLSFTQVALCGALVESSGIGGILADYEAMWPTRYTCRRCREALAAPKRKPAIKKKAAAAVEVSA